KKYASSGWASYDSHFFRFAERVGYQIDLASQHELHFSPEILNGYDCVGFAGSFSSEREQAASVARISKEAMCGNRFIGSPPPPRPSVLG
ncbi:hypothetical protein EN815_36765, partial [Mesorhizobium sp. M4B.F.Ca.ET.172.01.1.1]